MVSTKKASSLNSPTAILLDKLVELSNFHTVSSQTHDIDGHAIDEYQDMINRTSAHSPTSTKDSMNCVVMNSLDIISLKEITDR